MFGSVILEVAIGLILVFLLVSVICSAIREWIEALVKSRAAFLERGIRELLHDRDAKLGGLTRAFFNHPLIYSLFATDYVPHETKDHAPRMARGRGLPSYIPSRNFAIALLDLVTRGPAMDSASADPSAPVLSVESIRKNLWKLENPPVQRVLLTALDAAGNDIRKVQEAVEAWYDSGMDRVSGWYKRTTHWILFTTGLIVAVGLNVDAVSVARFLYHDDTAREAIVARAEQIARDSSIVNASFTEARAALDSLAIPVGWPRRPIASAPDSTGKMQWVFAPWHQTVVGWLITGLAATLGAPFWFDILNKIMVIRSTVKPREKSRDEGSEDRQPTKAPVSAAAPPAMNDTPTPLAQSGPPPAPPAPPPEPSHEHDDIDGCDVTESAEPTLDEHLPAAQGGVA